MRELISDLWNLVLKYEFGRIILWLLKQMAQSIYYITVEFQVGL